MRKYDSIENEVSLDVSKNKQKSLKIELCEYSAVPF